MAALDIDLTSIPELVGAAAVAYELAREDIAVFRVDPCTKKPTVSDWDGASTSGHRKSRLYVLANPQSRRGNRL